MPKIVPWCVELERRRGEKLSTSLSASVTSRVRFCKLFSNRFRTRDLAISDRAENAPAREDKRGIAFPFHETTTSRSNANEKDTFSFLNSNLDDNSGSLSGKRTFHRALRVIDGN